MILVRTEYLFNFDDAFEIHDDIEVLQRMGMALGLENGTSTEADLQKAKSMLPPPLAAFLDQVAREGAASRTDADDTEDEMMPQPGSSTAFEEPLLCLQEAAEL
ncbi:Transcription factor Dp-1 [Amphibalanus amphitrite]|uniref:Transcription factor Dp-1 n=1 Tax=Amphibalanus amphitrite TaxID=1232801 RepID=A0A6A4VJC0_AMPAM|nr:Transcription factor Dp-1 [Amphibalanus amphitrite]